MVYSDTTSKNGLLQDCEFLTGLGDAAITGNTTRKAQFTSLLNRHYHDFVVQLMLASGWQEFDDPNHGDRGFVKTYNLSANTEYVTVPASDKVLRVRRVEITYDGSVWQVASPLKRGQISEATSTQSDIAQTFSTANPFYSFEGNYIYLYPVPTSAVTGGLKVWVVREIDEFTTSDTTQEPGFPEPFHRYLSVCSSLDWLAVNKPKNTTVQYLIGERNRMAQIMKDYNTSFIEDGHLTLVGALTRDDYS